MVVSIYVLTVVNPNFRAFNGSFTFECLTCIRICSSVADNDMQGGVLDDAAAKDKKINHFVTIVGWGEDDTGTPYWTVRNRYHFLLFYSIVESFSALIHITKLTL